MKKYLCVIYALGILLLATLCFCGCNEEAVVSDNAPIETEVQTSKEEIVINKPDSREKVLFVTREFEDGEHKYKISMYGMQSAEDEEKYSDFRIELRDEKNFMILNTPLDMGEYGDSLFTVEENDRSKSFQFEGLKSENDTLVPLFSLQLLLDDVTLEKAVYRSFFKIKDGKIEYFTLKDEIAADFDDLGESYTITDNKINLYGNMTTNEIYGDFLYDDLFFATKRTAGGVVYKTMDFTDRGDEYTANLIITSADTDVEESTLISTIVCKVKLDIMNKSTNISSHFTKEYTFYGDPKFDMNIYQMKTDTGLDKAIIVIDNGFSDSQSLCFLRDDSIEEIYLEFGNIFTEYTIDGCNFNDKYGNPAYMLQEESGFLTIKALYEQIPFIDYYNDCFTKFMEAMKSGTVSSLFPDEYKQYYAFLDECEFSVVEKSDLAGINALTDFVYVGIINYTCTKSANKDIIAENTESSLFLYMSDSLECPYVKLRYNNDGYEEDSAYKWHLTTCEYDVDVKYNQAYSYECLWGDMKTHDKITLDSSDENVIEKLRIMSSASRKKEKHKQYSRRFANVSDINKLAEHFGIAVNPSDSKFYSSQSESVDDDPDFEMNCYFASTLSKDDENNTVTIIYYADPMMLFEVKTIEYTFDDGEVPQLVSTKVIEDNGGEVGFHTW